MPKPSRRPHCAGLAGVALTVLIALGGSGCRPGDAPLPEQDPAPGARASARSVLLVTIDTLRVDRVGTFGDAAASTPVLDALATRGAALEHVYSSVPLTLPSHAALMTGRWPHALGVRSNGTYVLGDEAATLAEAFRARGAATGAFVSSYVLARRFGLDQGFEVYDDRLEDGGRVRDFRSQVPAEVVARRFAAWLGDLDPSTPFFAWVHFYEPHLPWTPPTDLAETFADDPYRGEVAEADRRLGEVLAQIEASGRTDETLIVVTSDHGEGFGEHIEVGHGVFTYDEMLRVPLILAGPGVGSGIRVGDRVRLVDLAPSILELAGLAAPDPAIDGRSFAAALGSETSSERERRLGEESSREVVFESVLGQEDNGWAPILGLVDGSLKYISLPEPELYDLEGDPGETENLATVRRGDVMRLDERLRETLLATVQGERREIDDEERAHLEALGYVGTGSRAAEAGLDPKIGMRVDREMKDVQALLDARRLDEAAARLAEIRATWPEVELATMFWLEHGIAAARGDTEAAIEALRQGRARFPEVLQLGLRLGRYLIGAGSPEEGAAVAQEVLLAAPRETRARIVLAEARVAQSQPDEAIELYLQALEDEVTNVPVALAAAELLVAGNRTDEALHVLRDRLAPGALEAAPGSFFQAGAIAARGSELGAAEAFYRRGLELAPAGKHHLGLGLLLARQQRLKEARAEIRTALEVYGDELQPAERGLAEQVLRGGAGD